MSFKIALTRIANRPAKMLPTIILSLFRVFNPSNIILPSPPALMLAAMTVFPIVDRID